MRNIPSFGILEQAPFQGITDKSWTKYQGYPEVFRQVIETLQWDHSMRLPEIPYEEASAIRLHWYTFVKFIRRHADIHFHFEQKADHIVAKLHKTSQGTMGVVEFTLPLNRTPDNQIGLNRIKLMNIGLTQSKITEPTEATEVRPASIGNPGLVPPGFTSAREFTASLDETSSYNQEKRRHEEEMNRIEAEGELWRKANAWLSDAERFAEYFPLQQELAKLQQINPKLYEAIIKLTPEDRHQWKEREKLESLELAELTTQAETKYKDQAEASRTQALQKLLSAKPEDPQSD